MLDFLNNLLSSGLLNLTFKGFLFVIAIMLINGFTIDIRFISTKGKKIRIGFNNKYDDENKKDSSDDENN